MTCKGAMINMPCFNYLTKCSSVEVSSSCFWLFYFINVCSLTNMSINSTKPFQKRIPIFYNKETFFQPVQPLKVFTIPVCKESKTIKIIHELAKRTPSTSLKSRVWYFYFPFYKSFRNFVIKRKKSHISQSYGKSYS